METEKIQEKGDKMTVYEVSYLLLPSLAVEQVPAKAASLKEVVSQAGGELISDEDPVLIDLAYPMTKVVSTLRHKVNKGYFGWIKFEIPLESEAEIKGIEAVKKNFDADNEILRHLIIKTVKENTLINGKMKLLKEEKSRREDVAEDSQEEAELPKEEVVAEEEVAVV
ncbi:MAG: 30S ribosomal protein S6 [Patescibacteria group bacterium]